LECGDGIIPNTFGQQRIALLIRQPHSPDFDIAEVARDQLLGRVAFEEPKDTA